MLQGPEKLSKLDCALDVFYARRDPPLRFRDIIGLFADAMAYTCDSRNNAQYGHVCRAECRLDHVTSSRWNKEGRKLQETLRVLHHAGIDPATLFKLYALRSIYPAGTNGSRKPMPGIRTGHDNYGYEHDYYYDLPLDIRHYVLKSASRKDFTNLDSMLDTVFAMLSMGEPFAMSFTRFLIGYYPTMLEKIRLQQNNTVYQGPSPLIQKVLHNNFDCVHKIAFPAHNLSAEGLDAQGEPCCTPLSITVDRHLTHRWKLSCYKSIFTDYVPMVANALVMQGALRMYWCLRMIQIQKRLSTATMSRFRQ